jgi:hypothetical protein
MGEKRKNESILSSQRKWLSEIEKGLAAKPSQLNKELDGTEQIDLRG